MLGLIRMKQDRPAEAAIHFSTAAPLLQGDDARNAAALAATAHQRAGNDSAARTWQARASSAPGSTSTTPSLSSSRRAAGAASSRISDPATTETASGLATHATRHPASVSHPITSAPPIAGPLGKGFALQVGAFKDRQHAQQAATDAQKISQDNGLGGVRIVAAGDSFGQTLHLVQLGHFESRAAAAAARQRIGKLQYIVAPAAATATN
jgi:cell division protein FtsN